jgi:hypothetical protein
MEKENLVLKTWQKSSNEIAISFDEIFREQVNHISQEMCTSFDLLYQILHAPEKAFKDNDIQSALLYWGALNTIVSAIDLSRRGYTKEPQILMRNVLEVFATAFDFHDNPDRYDKFVKAPNKFDSTKSINSVKKLHPLIAQQWGVCSNMFTHVSELYMFPHQDIGGFAIGGFLHNKDTNINNMNISIIMGTFSVLNSVIEMTFINYVTNPKYWKKISEDEYEYIPDKKTLEKTMDNIQKSRDAMKELEE